MKILKKALISLSIILLNTTSVYATTTGTYVPESNSGVGKFFLFLLAIGLVALVLFIGYKMDKNEAQEKRKEKIIKQRDNDINDMYSKIYSSYEDNKKEVVEKTVEELPEVNFAPETEEFFKDVKNDETQKIDIVNDDALDAYSSLKPEINEVEVIEDIEETIYEEVEEDGYTEEEDVYESEDFGETQVISLDEDDDEEFDSTMVFDAGPLKNLDVNMNVEEKIINKISDVKGYDYEDNDLDLLALEQTIAEANIKKYTRDKNQEMIKVKRQPKKKETTKKEEVKKESKDTKKYTRKKSEKLEKETKKKETAKRYKAKKTTSKKEEKKVEEKVAPKTKKYTKVNSKKENVKEEKPKKERKTSVKEEAAPKPRRGRKPAVKEETAPKPKRGRKPAVKEEAIEKPKRGRKPSTKK